MAIPEYQRQVAAQTGRGQRLDPGSAARVYDVDLTRNRDFGARGLANLSEGILALANQREQIELSDRIVRFNQELNDFMYNQESGTMFTEEDTSADIGERTQTKLKELTDTYTKGLSVNAAGMFNRSVLNTKLSTQQRTNLHEAQQMDKWRTRKLGEATDVFAASIINAGGSPDAYDAAYDSMAGVFVATHGHITDDGERARLLTKLEKEGVIKATIAAVNKTPGIAERFLEDHRGAFTDETEYGQFLAKVKEGLIPHKADVMAQEIIEKYGFRTSTEEGNAFIEANSPEGEWAVRKKAFAARRGQLVQEENDRVHEYNELALQAIYSYGNSYAQYKKAKPIVDRYVQWLTSIGRTGEGQQIHAAMERQFEVGKYARQPSDSLTPQQMMAYKVAIIEGLEDGTVENDLVGAFKQFHTGGEFDGFLPPKAFNVISGAINEFNRGRKVSDGLYVDTRLPGSGTQGLADKIKTLLIDNGVSTVEARDAYLDTFFSLEKQRLEKGNPKRTDEEIFKAINGDLAMRNVVKVPERGFLFWKNDEAEISKVEAMRYAATHGVTYEPSIKAFLRSDGATVLNYDPSDPNRLVPIGRPRKPAQRRMPAATAELRENMGIEPYEEDTIAGTR